MPFSKTLPSQTRLPAVQPQVFPCLQWWLVYFKFGYYCGYVPYKYDIVPQPTKSCTGTGIQVKSSLIQKAISCVIMACALTMTAASMLPGVAQLRYTDGRKYFEVAADAGYVIHQFVVSSVMYRHSHRFQAIMEQIIHCPFVVPEKNFVASLPANVLKRLRYHFTKPRNLAKVLNLIWFSFFLQNSSGPMLDLLWPSLPESLVSVIYVFSPSWNNSPVTTGVYLHGSDESQRWLLFVQVFLYNYGWWLSYMCGLFVSYSCFTYGYVVNDFLRALNHPGVAPDRVRSNYNILVELIAEMNGVLGLMFLTSVAGSMPYYVAKIPELLNMYRNFSTRQVRRAILLFMYLYQLFYAASKYHKLEAALKNWICQEKNYKAFNSPDLKIFLFKLASCDGLALSMNGMFPLNFSLCASILSGLVAYTFLALQFAKE